MLNHPIQPSDLPFLSREIVHLACCPTDLPSDVCQLKMAPHLSKNIYIYTACICKTFNAFSAQPFFSRKVDLYPQAFHKSRPIASEYNALKLGSPPIPGKENILQLNKCIWHRNVEGLSPMSFLVCERNASWTPAQRRSHEDRIYATAPDVFSSSTELSAHIWITLSSWKWTVNATRAQIVLLFYVLWVFLELWPAERI